MEKSGHTKKTLMVLAVILAVLVFVSGFFLIGGETDPVTSTKNSNGIEASIIGADALHIISKIKSLKLDKGLFENPNFINLKDRTQTISTEPVGRENPFSDIR